jgi:hypothetical protein
MRRLATAALAVAFLVPLALARADDKADATGTWKWKVKFNDQEREFTLKLKADGDKLTGAMVGRDGKDTPIEEGTCKDGQVDFKVTRERDGNKFVIHYKGKVSGDTIKGKSEFERDGEKMEREWEAKRSKD